MNNGINFNNKNKNSNISNIIILNIMPGKMHDYQKYKKIMGIEDLLLSISLYRPPFGRVGGQKWKIRDSMIMGHLVLILTGLKKQ